MISYSFEQVQEAADLIKNQINFKPEDNQSNQSNNIGIILGSGLGGFIDKLEQLTKITKLPYSEITYFPETSVKGHTGQLVYAKLNNTNIFVMQGRFHAYEGHSAATVAFPVRVLLALGVKKFILTNAAGGIGEHLNVGDIMLFKDHINFTGMSPLVGHNDDRFGPRFLDMTHTYSEDLRNQAIAISEKLKFKIKTGVFLGVLGPCYETPAEIEMFRKLGGDAVAMSTIFESIAARHGGAEVLAMSCIVNKAAGITGEKLHHQEVTENAGKMAGRVSDVILGLLW